MARKLDPISLAMLNYIQTVDQVFGLANSKPTSPETNSTQEA